MFCAEKVLLIDNCIIWTAKVLVLAPQFGFDLGDLNSGFQYLDTVLTFSFSF